MAHLRVPFRALVLVVLLWIAFATTWPLTPWRASIGHGFAILRRWAGRVLCGGFVYTSNVDGHFQRAGFDPDRVVEVHGTIGAMQCLSDCGIGIFPSDPYEVAIDEWAEEQYRVVRAHGQECGNVLHPC